MKLGLCLAGGGIKGAAHIGVLKAFEEKGIRLNMISGASSGSIVATLYAAGYTPDEIYEFFKKYAKDVKYVDAKNILKLVSGLIMKNKISIKGLTAGKKLEKYMRDECAEKGIKNIKDIKFPLFISSVDLRNGDTYIFTNSKCPKQDKLKLVTDIDVAKAVRASCSYPGIFEPVEWNGTELIDGGIKENVPWQVMKNCGADKVISVVFKTSSKKECCKNLINVIDCSFGYLKDELFDYEIKGSGELIEIETSGISLLDYTKVDYLYELGYKIAKKYYEKTMK